MSEYLETIPNEFSDENMPDFDDPTFPDWNKRRWEYFNSLQSTPKDKQSDYQMSLIELDHQFSLDLLKW